MELLLLPGLQVNIRHPWVLYPLIYLLRPFSQSADPKTVVMDSFAPMRLACLYLALTRPAFLEFLDTVEKGCREHRWLQDINLAALVGRVIPSVAPIAMSVAIHQFANLTIAADGRRRYA